MVSLAGMGAAARGAAAAAGTFTSGILMISSARARFGRRRMNLRSSSAEISRWTPDLDLRSSASRISSKLGDTPVRPSRSWMKVSNSCCLAVSIDVTPVGLSRNERRTCRQHEGWRQALFAWALALTAGDSRLGRRDRFLIAARPDRRADRRQELLGIFLGHRV